MDRSKSGEHRFLIQDGKWYDLWNLPKGFVISGDLDLSHMNLPELPDLSGVVVDGNFTCMGNQLTTLKGAPKEVRGLFNCSENQLTTLKGAPEIVGDFACSYNQLTTLEGAPKVIKSGGFFCECNQLTTLEGAPEVCRDFDCRHNQLTTLEGAPKIVKGRFDCRHNQLTTFEGAPDRVGSFYCSDTPLTTSGEAPLYDRDHLNCSKDRLTTLFEIAQDGKCYDLRNLPEGFVIKGNLDLSYMDLTELPDLSRVIIKGDFSCSWNPLTTLKGAPKEVGGEFNCSYNRLTTLKGAPKKVGYSIYCCENLLNDNIVSKYVSSAHSGVLGKVVQTLTSSKVANKIRGRRISR